MGMYLMMMYVSLEQEEAVKHFFSTKGWSFQKPDLSVLTDRTGPLVIPVSEQLAAAVETRTPEHTEAGRKPVVATHPRTSAKTKISPKQQPKKGKATASKRSANTENREFEEILKEAELIAASVSEIGETGDNEGTQTSVKQEQNRDSFNVEQTDNYDDTYDDYDDFNEEDKGETEVPPIEFVNDEVMQGPSDETPTRKKRKLGDGSELSELDEIEDSQEAAIKVEPVSKRTTSTVTFDKQQIPHGTPSTVSFTAEQIIKVAPLIESFTTDQITQGISSSFTTDQITQGTPSTDGFTKEQITEGTPSKESFDKEQMTRESLRLVPSFHEGSSRRVYICDTCSKMYSSKYALRRHLNVHEEGKYKCSICHVYYNTAEDLDSHRQKSHTGPLLCSTCGKSFTRKSALKSHILRNHDETYKAKYRCEVGTCSRSFHTEKSFMEHINKHAQVKPYTCEKCRKSFTLKSTLRTHERACVKNVKFRCSECHKEFESSGALSNHKQSVHEHKLFPCSCGKIFKYLPGLISHKRKKGH